MKHVNENSLEKQFLTLTGQVNRQYWKERNVPIYKENTVWNVKAGQILSEVNGNA